MDGPRHRNAIHTITGTLQRNKKLAAKPFSKYSSSFGEIHDRPYCLLNCFHLKIKIDAFVKSQKPPLLSFRRLSRTQILDP
jgi:hypothetical protein